MRSADREALDEVLRRLGHIALIAKLMGESAETPLASAVRGLAWMLDDLDSRMDEVLSKAEALA